MRREDHTTADAAVLREELAGVSTARGRTGGEHAQPKRHGEVLEEPAFLDDDGPSAEIPPFVTTTNSRELFDLQPGETVSEAIARRNAERG
jgi:hypothetical protein